MMGSAASPSSSTTPRSYEDAVRTLNSTQTNAALLEVLRKAGKFMNLRSIPEMRQFVERLGYKVSDLDRLNAIHVAGTKGKGSTSAVCESVLRRLKVAGPDGKQRPLKTGLFTSPHLIEVRERIRINGEPIAKHLFAKYFFEVWDALERTKPADTNPETGMPEKPQYFRYLTLMAFHAFMREGVDVVLLEVGMGGAYDATNVIERPVVCGITSLGFDHVPLLGHTLADIAWHKAGVMKPGIPAYTVQQPEETIPVLQERAVELKASSLTTITSAAVEDMCHKTFGMPGAYQKVNGALAVALCREWVAQRRKAGIQVFGEEDAFRQGLEAANWPGRAQTYSSKQYPTVKWYLDGAHTKESMQVCADWFSDEYKALEDATKSGGEQVLLFNCTKGRDGLVLLKALAELHVSTVPFSRIVFCTNDAYPPGTTDGPTDQVNHTVRRDDHLTVQKELAAAWETLVAEQPDGSKRPVHIDIQPSIQDAVHSIAAYSTEKGLQARVLVTGSLYLIGGLLTVLEAPVR
ncbi:Folylpolyglutamate synthetase [Geranomyces variabilis]|uniref:Folylpolyglutamate synthase n=1 Tax=Geranomyces variabilis TaxID=109894 RepID=A0AAD5TP13_9FUNG|nr:Folylpolyglutamate synthetase [Geranomyces variabilis]